MRLTGIGLSALAVTLTCGTGAAFAQYGHASQNEYREAQERAQISYRDRDDHHDSDGGYGVYSGYSNDGGYSSQYAGRGYEGGDGGARIYVRTQRVPTYYNRGDDRYNRGDDRYNRDDDRRFGREERSNKRRGDEDPDRR